MVVDWGWLPAITGGSFLFPGAEDCSRRSEFAVADFKSFPGFLSNSVISCNPQHFPIQYIFLYFDPSISFSSPFVFLLPFLHSIVILFVDLISVVLHRLIGLEIIPWQPSKLKLRDYNCFFSNSSPSYPKIKSRRTFPR